MGAILKNVGSRKGQLPVVVAVVANVDDATVELKENDVGSVGQLVSGVLLKIDDGGVVRLNLEHDY